MGRRIATSYLTPREELMRKMLLTPNAEGNLFTDELPVQVTVIHVDGRRHGFWRSNEDADNYTKYISVERRASQAQRTQWYGK